MIQELQGDEVRDFIQKHENEDPFDLSLKAPKFNNIPVQLAIEQIRVRKKARKKLPEWYGCGGLIFPHGVSIEQCSSEVTAKYKARLINGKSLVDLTGGSGVDTWYLSRSFSQTVFIEPSTELCTLARHNFEALGDKKIEVVESTAEAYLEKAGNVPDWYFLDPSRRDDGKKRVFLLSDCQPNLASIHDDLIHAKKGAMIKLSPLLDLKNLVELFPRLCAIDVLSVDNDCKELLLTITNDSSSEAVIRTINWQSGKEQNFEFSFSEEQKTPSSYSEPQEYLYEPNTSILKAGAFKKVGSDFGLHKLHPNSHLYTSKKLQESFPGRVFKIDQTVPLKTKVLRSIVGKKANITTRNFPMSVAEIRKKTGLKEGGENYIFATTLLDGGHKLVICKKV